MKRLSEDDYQLLLETQGGRCSICQTEPPDTRRLAIDHDHQHETVRGLLCSRCNLGLGYFQDNPALLREAAQYLDDHNRAFWDTCPKCPHGPVEPQAKEQTNTTGQLKMIYRCPACGHIWRAWRSHALQWL